MARQDSIDVWQGQNSPVKELGLDAAYSAGEMKLFLGVIQQVTSELDKIHTAAKGKQNAFAGVEKNTLEGIRTYNSLHAEAIEMLAKERAGQETLRVANDMADKAREKARVSEIKLAQARERAMDNYEKKLKKEQIEQQKLASIYEKVDRKLSALVKEYRDLAVKKQLNITLTEKEEKRFGFLTEKIRKYDQVLKITDASSGKFGRNVGNYSSAFDGLGSSINQLTRELPAFAVNAQTGFLAISNNLPIFFDQVGRLKQANIELKKAGEPTKSVLKQIGSSLFSFQSLLSIGVTLLTVYGAKIIEWALDNEKAEKALKLRQETQKRANEETKKATEFIGKESAEYVGYILQLKRTNAGSKERSELIAEINKKYGTTLKNIQDETRFQQLLNNEIKNYIQFQRIRYTIEKNQELIQRNLTFQDKLRRQINERLEEEKRLMADIADIEDRRAKSGLPEQEANQGFSSGAQESALTAVRNALNGLNGEMNSAKTRLEQYGLILFNANGSLKDYDYTLGKTTETVHKNTTELQANNNALSENYDRLNESLQVIQAIYNLKGEQAILPIDDEVVNELLRQFESIRESGEYNVDQLEKFIRGSYDARKEMARDNAKFEIDQLRLSLEQQSIIDGDRLRQERDKLIADVNESKVSESQKAADRAAIEVSYQARLTELLGVQAEKYRIFALKREQIELQLKNTIVGINQEEADRLNDINNQLNEAAVDRADETNAEVVAKAKKAEEDQIKRLKLKGYYLNKTDEEIQRQLLENDIERLSQTLALESAAGHDTLDIELELAEKKRQLDKMDVDSEKKKQKELADLRQKGVQAVIDGYKRASEEREKLLEDEIDASKQLEADLKAQANAGVDTAQQSLAAQEDITKQKIDAAKEEAKKQEDLERLKVAYSLFEQFISKGDNVAVAGGKTTAGMKIIEGIVAGFKKFFHGADDTGGDGPMRDQYGPITGVTHKHEQVFSEKDRREIRNPITGRLRTRAEVKEIVRMYDSPELHTMLYNRSVSSSAAFIPPAPSPESALDPLLNKFDTMIDILKNQPSELFGDEWVEGMGKVLTYERKQKNMNLKKVFKP